MKAERIITIGDSEYHYSSSYFTSNKWVDNDTFVGVRSKHPEIGFRSYPYEYERELVKISLVTGEITPLCNDVLKFEDHLVSGNKVYYTTGHELREINLDTHENNLLYKSRLTDDDKSVMECPHITNDGKYITLYIRGDGNNVEFIKVNTKTREGGKFYERNFKKPFNDVAHLMICPEDHELMFFCHEGETFYISNRLWLYDMRTGKEWNIAKQTLNQDGNLGDCFGHEMWTPDGKGLYFVKYACSPSPPCGICYVDVETGKYELLYSKYKYWHVGVSQDGRYLTADTQYSPKQSEIIVIDTKTGEESCIDMPPMTAIHPCHPHPQLSPDNKKVIYTSVDDKGRICIRVAFLEK